MNPRDRYLRHGFDLISHDLVPFTLPEDLIGINPSLPDYGSECCVCEVAFLTIRRRSELFS